MREAELISSLRNYTRNLSWKQESFPSEKEVYQALDTSAAEIKRRFGSLENWLVVSGVVLPYSSDRAKYTHKEVRQILKTAAQDTNNHLTIEGYRQWRRQQVQFTATPDIATIKRYCRNSLWYLIMRFYGIRPVRAAFSKFVPSEELLTDIKEISNGHYLTMRQYDKQRPSNKLASASIAQRFGGWKQTMEEAGIKIPESDSHQERGVQAAPGQAKS